MNIALARMKSAVHKAFVPAWLAALLVGSASGGALLARAWDSMDFRNQATIYRAGIAEERASAALTFRDQLDVVLAAQKVAIAARDAEIKSKNELIQELERNNGVVCTKGSSTPGG